MDLRGIIWWIFEGIGVFIMLIGVFIMSIPLLLLCLYALGTGPYVIALVMRGIENPFYAAQIVLIFVILQIICLIVGGVIALSGYIMIRARMVTTQQRTQDTAIRTQKQENPPPQVKNILMCPNCRGVNNKENIFCRYCGQRLRKE